MAMEKRPSQMVLRQMSAGLSQFELLLPHFSEFNHMLKHNTLSAQTQQTLQLKLKLA